MTAIEETNVVDVDSAGQVIVYEISARREQESWNEGLFIDWDNAQRFILRDLKASSCSPNPLVTHADDLSDARWERKSGNVFKRKRIEYRIIPRHLLDLAGQWPAGVLKVLTAAELDALGLSPEGFPQSIPAKRIRFRGDEFRHVKDDLTVCRLGFDEARSRCPCGEFLIEWNQA